jgi:hypothetical protein
MTRAQILEQLINDNHLSDTELLLARRFVKTLVTTLNLRLKPSERL